MALVGRSHETLILMVILVFYSVVCCTLNGNFFKSFSNVALVGRSCLTRPCSKWHFWFLRVLFLHYIFDFSFKFILFHDSTKVALCASFIFFVKLGTCTLVFFALHIHFLKFISSQCSCLFIQVFGICSKIL